MDSRGLQNIRIKYAGPQRDGWTVGWLLASAVLRS